MQHRNMTHNSIEFGVYLCEWCVGEWWHKQDEGVKAAGCVPLMEIYEIHVSFKEARTITNIKVGQMFKKAQRVVLKSL